MRRLLPLAALLLAAPAARADAAADAKQVFTTHCYRCHGKDGEAEGGFDYVLDLRKLVSDGKVTPGKPDESRLLKRMTATRKPMPPEDEKPRPSAVEIAQVRAWIAAATTSAATVDEPKPAATLISEAAILRAIRADLESVHPTHAKYRRYFALTPNANDPATTPADLRLLRAGVAKLLNSLSWRERVVRPQPLLDGAVLAIDLRDLDWDRTDGWGTLLSRYPYGLKHDHLPDEPGLQATARTVYALAATELPVIRADWFLANASLPPLYDKLLGLPETAHKLEARLGVDVADNFLRDRLARAGFGKSGVSNQNRLIERHDGTHGAYWKSYDFKSETGAGKLVAKPLGPLNLFPVGRHPFAELAFKHDGGEIIFNLPNGLQGYMLIDAAGKKIDEGPADVVRDKNETAGRNTLIVNGLSCMACHARGMIRDFTETVRDGAGVGGESRDKLRRLYPERPDLDRLMLADEQRFLAAVERACGPDLRVGPDAAKVVDDFPEPIGAFAKPFLRGQVTLAAAARELGLANADELRGAIRTNDDLRDRLGLRPLLAPGGAISRGHWEEVKGLTTVFHEAARILERGEPKLRR